VQARRQVSDDAVFFREDEQARTIRGTKQLGEPQRVVRWRSALKQNGPLVPERRDIGEMR